MVFQRKLNADEEKQIVDLYLQGASAIKIAQQFNLSHATVLNYLKRHDIKRRTWSNKLSEADIKKIIQAYKAGVSSYILAEQYQVTPPAILHWLCKHNIPTRKGKEAQENRVHKRRYSLNENYFDLIDTEEKAYWLGFLAADGSVRFGTKDHPRSAVVRLKLSIIDKNHVEKFCSALGTDSPIKLNDRYAIASIHSYHIVNSLSKYGIIPNKTFSTYFPILEPSLERHFIRGIVDGDGCFSMRKLKTGTLDPKFNVIGYKSLIIAVAEKLRQGCKIKGSLHPAYGCSEDIWRFSVGGRLQVARLHKYLYDGATVYLDRKKKLCFD